jgi:hypothetical protein
VSWEKVDVSFHNSKARYAAHSVIQVLSCYTQAFVISDGKIRFGA